MLPLSDHAIFAHSDSFLNGHQLLAPNNVVASSQLCIKMCLVGYLGWHYNFTIILMNETALLWICESFLKCTWQVPAFIKYICFARSSHMTRIFDFIE